MRKLVVGIATLLVLAGVAGAATNGWVDLGWDWPTNYVDGTAITNPVAAKIYLGTDSNNLDRVEDAGTTNRIRITGLTPGVQYCFAATAYVPADTPPGHEHAESDRTSILKMAIDKPAPGGPAGFRIIASGTFNLTLDVMPIPIE